MNSTKLKIIGIIIAVLSIFVVILAPGMYRNIMENKYRDDITTIQGTVRSVSYNSEYHRGGKGSRGSTHHIYKILASSNGEMKDLIKHDGKEKIQIEKNDNITIYCLNDKYAYAPDDFYIMDDMWKAIMLIPLFVGVGMVFVGSFMGKNNY